MSQAQMATGSMITSFSLKSMRSSVRNGTKKWPKMMTMPTHHQVPTSRNLNQKISSGRLAFH